MPNSDLILTDSIRGLPAATIEKRIFNRQVPANRGLRALACVLVLLVIEFFDGVSFGRCRRFSAQMTGQAWVQASG